MAHDTTLNQVLSDYLNALDWLQNSALKSWTHQWTYAPLYLSGSYLKNYQRALHDQSQAPGPASAGVLRADHHIEVRRFSEDSDQCVLIDTQSQRRMATYDTTTLERVHTQDLGEVTVVYRMAYDARSRRWKIDGFIQQLPSGWGNPKLMPHIMLMAELSAHSRHDR